MPNDRAPQPAAAFHWAHAPWGRVLVCEPLAQVAPHMFTAGDLALRDDPAEWEAVASALDLTPDRLRLVRQVHGADVARALRGSRNGWAVPEADIVISDDPTVAPAVRVADCAPILIADQRLGVVGAAHAGWRGTAARAAELAVRAMEREFGSSPTDLIAAIGPSLGPCCGEVGREVVDAFRATGHPESSIERWFSDGPRGRPYFDLWRANVDQLIESGVRKDAVYVAGLCSKTHAGILHSYRVAGIRAGRMAGIIKALAT